MGQVGLTKTYEYQCGGFRAVLRDGQPTIDLYMPTPSLGANGTYSPPAPFHLQSGQLAQLRDVLIEAIKKDESRLSGHKIEEVNAR